MSSGQFLEECMPHKRKKMVLLDSHQWHVVGSYDSAHSTVGQGRQHSFPSIVCGDYGTAYFRPFFMLLSSKGIDGAQRMFSDFFLSEWESWDFFSYCYGENCCLWKRGPNSILKERVGEAAHYHTMCLMNFQIDEGIKMHSHARELAYWYLILGDLSGISIAPNVLLRNGVRVGILMHLKPGWVHLKPSNNFQTLLEGCMSTLSLHQHHILFIRKSKT